MLATIIKSRVAVQTKLAIIETFVNVEKLASTTKGLSDNVLTR